ncbi:leucine/isoleucine/valine transporter ATP-binding subunit [compost metagenome]
MLVELKRRGITIVLVEQNFRFAAPLADRHYLIEHGQVVEHFTAAELDGKRDQLNAMLGV